jgi:branched-chain amino acid transport system substrate-binding protein
VSRPRKLTLLTALLASSVALTACGSSGGSGSSDSGKKTIKLGFQGPLSGDNSQLGINALNGVKTAIQEAKDKGDLPFNVELVTSDDIGKPEQGATAAQRLIDDKSVVAVIGPMFSGATKAAEPSFSGANLLSVSPSATNPQLTSLGFKTFFRVIPPDDAQGQEAANYLSKVVKAKTVYSLDDKSEYGTGLSTVVEKQLKANGTTVVHDGIPPTKNYTAQADKIIAANPDALYYSGYYAEFGLLVKALKGKGFKGVIMSGDGSNDDKFIAAAGKENAEGVLLSCPCGDANVDPNAKDFLASYKKINNNALPGTYSPEAYDATNAILSVLKSLGDGATDRVKVAAAFKTVNYKGITKTIAFTPTGEVTEKIVFIYKVSNGARGVLGTTTDLVK